MRGGGYIPDNTVTELSRPEAVIEGSETTGDTEAAEVSGDGNGGGDTGEISAETGAEGTMESDQKDDAVQEPQPYLPKNAGQRAGWIYEEGHWYYYDTPSQPAAGWRYIGSRWYFFDPDDTQFPKSMVSGRIKNINGVNYGFYPGGNMATGWFYMGGHWYYFMPGGAMKTGWMRENGVWYYLKPQSENGDGVMASDETVSINGSEYHFYGNGAMGTGWIATSQGWLYAYSWGNLKYGWLNDKGNWFYLDAGNGGIMIGGRKAQINGAEYFFSDWGNMRTGWIYAPGDGWYYGTDYGLKSGWMYEGNRWYYFYPAESDRPYRMAENERIKIGGNEYLFRSGGAMQTGWIYAPGDGWYYGTDYGLVSGWLYVGNRWYYFYPAESDRPFRMAENERVTIGGREYRFQSGGAMQTGWIYENGRWFYLNSWSGQPVTGWHEVNGKYYYFYDKTDSDIQYGQMAVSTRIGDREVSADGSIVVVTTELMKRIAYLARTNQGVYPARPDYCAEWVSGVYMAAGMGRISGDAIDFWENHKHTGSESMDNIPVGAIVCGSGSGYMGSIYGHVGIYLGDGMVANNRGYFSVESLSNWISWQTATCRGKRGWIGWVFPGGVPGGRP